MMSKDELIGECIRIADNLKIASRDANSDAFRLRTIFAEFAVELEEAANKAMEVEIVMGVPPDLKG